MENRESPWYNSVQVQRTRDVMSEGRKRWIPQLRKRENVPLLCLFVLWRPWKVWMKPTHISERGLLKSTESNVISSRNILTGTPRNNVLPARWASLSAVNTLSQSSSLPWIPRLFTKPQLSCHLGFYLNIVIPPRSSGML